MNHYFSLYIWIKERLSRQATKVKAETRDEDSDPFGPPDPLLFSFDPDPMQPVPTDIKNHLHLKQNINQNQ